MTVVLALETLYDAVVARMDADTVALDPTATPVPQPFGWREPAKRTGSMRIVWVPGDDESGDVGELGPARNPGRNPRSLATLRELFTVYIEAADITAPENERAQYTATRLLFDAWLRCVHLAARGTYSIESARWVNDKATRRYGATLRVLATIEAMVPDAPLEIAPTDTRASIDVELLDVTENVTTPIRVDLATTGPIDLEETDQTIDGHPLEVDDRVLVKDQADGEDNGLWLVGADGWTRATWPLAHGTVVYVSYGDANGGALFELTTPDPITIGTTPLTFARITA